LFKKKLTPTRQFEKFAAHTETKVQKMRTKTLLLTAALSAVSLTTSMAQQVFSVNAVGFVNVPVPPGFSMIANPLNAPTNTIPALFAGVPDGTIIYKFDGTSFSVNALDLGEWSAPTQELKPGEGAFIRNPGTAPFTVTFVGEVVQGNQSNPIPAGFSIVSSAWPSSGKLDTDLKFPAVDGDIVYQFSNAQNTYVIHALDLGEWSAGVPTPAVGESFFVKKVAAAAWTRNFSVNQ
jgi:hypothetical protein